MSKMSKEERTFLIGLLIGFIGGLIYATFSLFCIHHDEYWSEQEVIAWKEIVLPKETE